MAAELELRNTLPTAADMNAAALYAERLSGSLLLPKQYFKQPANVLYAIEYGRMIGLAPMAAIIGVHVIEGKPSASAALISALVRRAGHKLRIRGDARSATAQIVRSDDPDFTFEVTFTIEDAKQAELTKKAVWRNYPASMLKARAITQCARDACEEALMGMHYTPEELGAEIDDEGELVASSFTPQDAADAVVRKEQRERVDIAPRGERNPLDDGFDLPGSIAPMSDEERNWWTRQIAILCTRKRGISGSTPEARQARLDVIEQITGLKVTSSKDLHRQAYAAVKERLDLEPDFVEDAVIVDDATAAAEAQKLAATDPETDPDRIEADLLDGIESAGSPDELREARVRAEAAQAAGAIGSAALAVLSQAADRRNDSLKADAGWSHRTTVGAGLRA